MEVCCYLLLIVNVHDERENKGGQRGWGHAMEVYENPWAFTILSKAIEGQKRRKNGKYFDLISML